MIYVYNPGDKLSSAAGSTMAVIYSIGVARNMGVLSGGE
jgi:hypothetical protein